MNRITVITVVSIMAVGLVGRVGMAASTITYTLGLGGDNHAAQYEASSSVYPQFDTSVGTYTEADEQTFDVTDPLTWSAKVDVDDDGAHVHSDPNILDCIPLGAGNLVFSLELRHYDGQQAGRRQCDHQAGSAHSSTPLGRGEDDPDCGSHRSWVPLCPGNSGSDPARCPVGDSSSKSPCG